MPKLTKRVIDATVPPVSGQFFLRDTELPGFALRVTAGSKSFILERRIRGRVRRLTLGAYGPLTVEHARKLAHEKIAEIIGGGDPAQEQQDRHKEATFGELERLYLERHGVRKKSVQNDIAALNKYCASWRIRKLTSISRNDVARLHAAIGAAGHPYGANRVVALLRVMFNLAADWGYFQGENPATRIKFFPEEARDRFVHPAELPRLFAALREEPNPYARGAFIVALLTGARRDEVLEMQWTHLDLEQALWRIPETKAGRPHLVPVPRPVVQVLRGLPRLHGNPYVFPGRWGRNHLVNVAKPWKRIRNKAQLPDVRIHDLRRTVGSWLAGSGASLPLIGKVLNHSQVSTTAVYARLDLDPVRAALEANAQKMVAVGGGPWPFVNGDNDEEITVTQPDPQPSVQGNASGQASNAMGDAPHVG